MACFLFSFALRVSKKINYATLKQDFSSLCNLKPSEIVFMESNINKVVPSLPGAIIEDNVKLKNHNTIHMSLMAFQIVCNTVSISDSDTPLIDTPSVSNDSIAKLVINPFIHNVFTRIKALLLFRTEPDAVSQNEGLDFAVCDISDVDKVSPTVNTSLYVDPSSSAQDSGAASSCNNSFATASNTSASGDQLPLPAVSLTPSSSGYASDTWRSESHFMFALHSKLVIILKLLSTSGIG